MDEQSSTDLRPFLYQVSTEFEGQQYYGSYIYDQGVICVGWNNSTDYTLHQLSAITSDPQSKAITLLRQLLVAAKFRGEI